MAKETNVRKLRREYFNTLNINKVELPKVISKMVEALPSNIPYKLKLAMSLSEMGTLVSMFNPKIKFLDYEVKDQSKATYTDVTLNQQFYLWADSGVGKDKTLGEIRKATSPVMSKLMAYLDSENEEYSKDLCIEETGKVTKWKQYKTTIDPYPSISTERGTVKSMARLSKLKAGSFNIYSSELGNALTSNENILAMLDVVNIGYDVGFVPAKLVSTADLQIESVKGLNINALMFSSIKSIIKEERTKQKFISQMEAQIGRRGCHIFVNEPTVEYDFDSLEEEMEFMNIKSNNGAESLTFVATKLDTVLGDLPIGTSIKMDKECRELYRHYTAYNKDRAKDISSLYSLYKVATEHAQWRALKLAGIFTLLTGKREVTQKHLLSAISVMEFFREDIKELQKELQKDNYERFVDYSKSIVNEHGVAVMSANTLYKMKILTSVADKTVQAMVDTANTYAVKAVFKFDKSLGRIAAAFEDYHTPTNIMKMVKVNGEYVEDRGQSVVVTAEANNKDTFNVSVLNLPTGISKDARKKLCVDGFVAKTKLTFKELAEVTVNATCAYSPYKYKDGYRNSANTQGKTNLLVLDVDDTEVKFEDMHERLKGINHIIATSSDATNRLKYRIILHLDTKVDLSGFEWKVFSRSVANMLDVSIDTNVAKSSCYFGYDGSDCLIVEDGTTIATETHVLMAKSIMTKEEEEVDYDSSEVKATLHELWDDRINLFEFAYYASKGKRSTLLYAAMMKAKRIGFDKDSIKELITEINELMPSGGISYNRLKYTLLDKI